MPGRGGWAPEAWGESTSKWTTWVEIQVDASDGLSVVGLVVPWVAPALAVSG